MFNIFFFFIACKLNVVLVLVWSCNKLGNLQFNTLHHITYEIKIFLQLFGLYLVPSPLLDIRKNLRKLLSTFRNSGIIIIWGKRYAFVIIKWSSELGRKKNYFLTKFMCSECLWVALPQIFLFLGYILRTKTNGKIDANFMKEATVEWLKFLNF